MSVLDEDSPKVKYEFALLDNPIAYRMRTYGHMRKMSEMDILYMTVAALAGENKRLQQMVADFVARTPVAPIIIPAHAAVHFQNLQPSDPSNTD